MLYSYQSFSLAFASVFFHPSFMLSLMMCSFSKLDFLRYQAKRNDEGKRKQQRNDEAIRKAAKAIMMKQKRQQAKRTDEEKNVRTKRNDEAKRKQQKRNDEAKRKQQNAMMKQNAMS
ncbi:hypothetical protein Tco_0669076 [Tanacetum coccineum]